MFVTPGSESVKNQPGTRKSARQYFGICNDNFQVDKFNVEKIRKSNF